MQVCVGDRISYNNPGSTCSRKIRYSLPIKRCSKRPSSPSTTIPAHTIMGKPRLVFTWAFKMGFLSAQTFPFRVLKMPSLVSEASSVNQIKATNWRLFVLICRSTSLNLDGVDAFECWTLFMWKDYLTSSRRKQPYCNVICINVGCHHLSTCERSHFKSVFIHFSISGIHTSRSESISFFFSLR